MNKDYIPFWGSLKEKPKSFIRTKDYENELSLVAKTKFKFNNFPSQRLVELISDVSLRCGKGIIFKYEDTWICSNVTFTGLQTPLGFLADAIGYTYNGHTVEFKDWQNNPDCVVFFRNMNWSPDFSIARYSDYLNQIDISEEIIVKLSRIKPLLIASDDTIKKAIDKIFEDIESGKFQTITDERLAGLLKDADVKAIDKLDITDPSYSQWLQYLSNYREDVLSRFLFVHGMSMNQNTKMAQMTVDEVTAGDDSKLIWSTDELNYMQQLADECNKKFGWNCSIEFSHCWKHEHPEDTEDNDDIEDDDVEEVTDDENIGSDGQNSDNSDK